MLCSWKAKLGCSGLVLLTSNRLTGITLSSWKAEPQRSRISSSAQQEDGDWEQQLLQLVRSNHLKVDPSPPPFLCQQYTISCPTQHKQYITRVNYSTICFNAVIFCLMKNPLMNLCPPKHLCFARHNLRTLHSNNSFFSFESLINPKNFQFSGVRLFQSCSVHLQFAIFICSWFYVQPWKLKLELHFENHIYI